MCSWPGKVFFWDLSFWSHCSALTKLKVLMIIFLLTTSKQLLVTGKFSLLFKYNFHPTEEWKCSVLSGAKQAFQIVTVYLYLLLQTGLLFCFFTLMPPLSRKTNFPLKSACTEPEKFYMQLVKLCEA